MILTTKGIDDMCLKYFCEANAIACRRVKKDDMRRCGVESSQKTIIELCHTFSQPFSTHSYISFATHRLRALAGRSCGWKRD